jgi:PAS domain S-box-containing protein
LLAAVLESGPVSLVVVDAAGRIVIANRESGRLFGYAHEDLLGQPVDNLIPERLRGGHGGMRGAYVATPVARRMGEGRDLFGLRSDGTEFPIEIGLNPIATSHGVVVLAAIVDLTEREAAAQRLAQRAAELARRGEELERANRALELSNIELQQFAYVASHDLQSPLRAIAGYLELIEMRAGSALDAQAHQWLGLAVAGAARMSALIRDLLGFAQVDSRALPFTAVALDDVVADATGLLAASIADSGASIEVHDLPIVSGDRSQLVQLLQNLIGNAVKYRGAAPPRVVIEARADPAGWAISVRDNGIGIPPESREKVFEIFRRLHTAAEYPGTGIGLAVCRRVVHRHGGSIVVSDAPGGGCVFTFTLPKRQED